MRKPRPVSQAFGYLEQESFLLLILFQSLPCRGLLAWHYPTVTDRTFRSSTSFSIFPLAPDPYSAIWSVFSTESDVSFVISPGTFFFKPGTSWDILGQNCHISVAKVFIDIESKCLLVFMGVYYRLPGIIADISLVIYTLLTLACYSIAGVTLTLPGIAGFILSIGMAVDANVLIFERTREELRTGKTLYRSVESGFYRAFSSILDSNVTTLIACGALFWLGSGLVKGFALTLAIGVLVSMFTAVSCSRTLMLLTVLSLPKVRQKPELFCPNLNQ